MTDHHVTCPPSRRVLLPGGSGFLGIALAETLATSGYEPVVLTRRPETVSGPGRPVFWDGKTIDDAWLGEMDGAMALINLAGKGVNCRPTAKNRREIRESRVRTVTVLGEAARLVSQPPPVWVQASSLAIYGNAGDRFCDEAARVATAYPADVCTEWEAALGRALLPAMRWVVLRIGFVLGTDGGALPLLSRLCLLGLGGSIGSGEQFISWLHLEDMLRIFLRAVEEPSMNGVYNATAERPVTNREFMQALRRVHRRPWSPRVPSLAVKTGAPLIGSDPGIALTGRRGFPARLLDEGFLFRHGDVATALRDLIKNPCPNPS